MVRVVDVSSLILRGSYSSESFDSLQDALSHIGEEIRDGVSNQFEIHTKTGSIYIDARDYEEEE